MQRLLGVILSVATAAAIVPARAAPAKVAPASMRSPKPPAVINLTLISAERAAQVLRGVYGRAEIRVDRPANALIVLASADEVTGMRTIVSGIDVKSPIDTTVDSTQVHNAKPREIIDRLRPLFQHSRFAAGPNKTIIISATPADVAEIKAIVMAMDTPTTTPSPKPQYPAEAIRVTQRSPSEIARAIARSVPGVTAAVSGLDLLLRGAPEDIAHAKSLATQLDLPPAGVSFTEVYRLHNADAGSAADLLRRSFPNAQIQVDGGLNAISVLAAADVQRRIGDGVAQLDAAPPGATSGGAGGGTMNSEVISLKAAIPGLNGASSTSATDIATTITQALAAAAPDLKVTVPPNSTQLVLTGSSYSIKLAKDLIDQLDTPQPLVVLDTEVLEVDETDAKNLGLQFAQGGAFIGTTFTEVAPPQPATGGTPPPLYGMQPLSRTPITFGVQLNLLIQQGKARVLADPRISTLSGRTASIRAGDTLAILTTTGGGTGTVATTQLQTFQTGVTLDITPVVNSGDFISVTLHPSVNSLSGIINGVPQISTRDTITTVGLTDNQTLVIGGLIQETANRTEQKIPLLGDVPLIGSLFRSTSINNTRNELVITVTPHVVRPGENNVQPGRKLPPAPSPQPLPTPQPDAVFPTATPSPSG